LLFDKNLGDNLRYRSNWVSKWVLLFGPTFFCPAFQIILDLQTDFFFIRKFLSHFLFWNPLLFKWYLNPLFFHPAKNDFCHFEISTRSPKFLPLVTSADYLLFFKSLLKKRLKSVCGPEKKNGSKFFFKKVILGVSETWNISKSYSMQICRISKKKVGPNSTSFPK
jgi:hypothetical protein